MSAARVGSNSAFPDFWSGFASRHPRRIDLGLERVIALLDRLGRPQDRLPAVIHVAGTNGKGSTIAMLRAILNAHGKCTHVYTSPHLISFRERIVLSDQVIGDEQLRRILSECEAASAGLEITVFELTTAAAMLAFSRAEADYTLLETGLGGRLDATNVVRRPAMTVITSISRDHEEFLGAGLDRIASEKAGILKRGVPAVVSRQAGEPLAVIRKRAAQLGVPLLEEGAAWQAVRLESAVRWQFVTADKKWELPKPALAGDHQITNAGAAVAAFVGLAGTAPDPASIGVGLRRTSWPGRLQFLDGNAFPALPPGWEVWLDGAHNAGAAQALARQAADWADKPLHFVVGMLRSKDARGFFNALKAVASSVTAVPVSGENNGYPPDELAAFADEAGIPALTASDVNTAITALKRRDRSASRIVICGSLYLAGSVLEQLNTGSGAVA